jgi:hypothetical protein
LPSLYILWVQGWQTSRLVQFTKYCLEATNNKGLQQVEPQTIKYFEVTLTHISHSQWGQVTQLEHAEYGVHVIKFRTTTKQSENTVQPSQCTEDSDGNPSKRSGTRWKQERTNKQRHNRAHAKQRQKGTKRPFFSFQKNKKCTVLYDVLTVKK